jgi:hypothetical protein
MVLVFPLCALLPWHGAAAAAVDFALAKPKNVLFIAVRPHMDAFQDLGIQLRI